MNKNKIWSIAVGIITAAVILFIGLFGMCISINIHDEMLWILIAVTIFVSVLLARLTLGIKDFGKVTVTKRTGSKGRRKEYSTFRLSFKPYILPIAIICVVILAAITGSQVFNSTKYAEILTVKDTEFSQDVPESAGTDSIALMDTASAKMLGDREIGSLSNVVSQFNVSYDYSQIDFGGKPIKNRDNGVCGYVTVDPVSMSASYQESKGMKYVPSAYLLEDAYRHIWLKYPTTMFGNLHFEIDEEGHPYYIASVYDRTISLFGGEAVTGCIILDPVTGETEKYDVADIPRWVDIVFDGDLICKQYNWHGTLQNGFVNSIIGKKGCKQITTYYSEETEDEEPISDYGYVAKDGDIWIYTGVTSVNGDSSNIGFLLANERTGESHYFAVAGADEKSAMAAAEGEVQEKGYQASFPSLINVNGNSTYIMVLKDDGGLVKLYAAVNVEQYNLVTTAATQAQCIANYKEMLGISEKTEEEQEAQSTTITVSSIKYIDIDGNTYIYLIDADDNFYKAKASSFEQMLLLKEGDKVELTCSGSKILSFKKLS